MSNNILSIDSVMAAMGKYAEAQSIEASEREAYDGWSWDYHGSHYILATEKAKKHAESVLEQYIDACVEKALEKRNGSA